MHLVCSVFITSLEFTNTKTIISDRYEGDMVMTKSMRYWLLLNTVNGIEALESGAVDTSKAMGAAGNVPIWTNRKEGNNYVVPYEIDSSIGKFFFFFFFYRRPPEGINVTSASNDICQ